MAHYDSLDINKFSPDSVLSILLEENDRTMAISAASLLEHVIGLCISFKFRRFPSQKDFDEMFDGMGPLASFSAKIMIGYHMGCMTSDMRSDAQIIKKIRNEFAHDFSEICFKTHAIASRCNMLKYKSTKLQDPIESKVPSGAKGQFVRSVSTMMANLMGVFHLTAQEKMLISQNSAKLLEAAQASLLAQKSIA